MKSADAHERGGSESDHPGKPDRPMQRSWRTVATTWAGRDDDGIAPADLERLRPVMPHEDRNTDAEYALYRIHGRFQRYADRFLFANERLLGFALWSEQTSETWRRRVSRLLTPGQAAAIEGILLLTDRYVMHVRDVAEIYAGVPTHGYIAWVTAHERIQSATVELPPAGPAVLTIELRSTPARRQRSWLFPRDEYERLRSACEVMRRFSPDAQSHALRAPGYITEVEHRFVPRVILPGRKQAADDDGLLPEQRDVFARRLHEWLDAHRDPNGTVRRVYWQGPGIIGQSQRYLAVTRAQIVLIAEDPDLPVEETPIDAISDVLVRDSALAREVTWYAGPSERDATTVAFPAIQAEASFALGAIMRQALTLLPVESKEPEPPPTDA